MTLFDLAEGERANVTSVQCENTLKARLCALGVFLGARVNVLKITVRRGSFVLLAGGTRVALRSTLAKQIFVQREGRE